MLIIFRVINIILKNRNLTFFVVYIIHKILFERHQFYLILEKLQDVILSTNLDIVLVS